MYFVKIAQIKSLGCSAFALLWDDIDTTLPQEDREQFQTLAQAHVKVNDSTLEHQPFLTIFGLMLV